VGMIEGKEGGDRLGGFCIKGKGEHMGIGTELRAQRASTAERCHSVGVSAVFECRFG